MFRIRIWSNDSVLCRSQLKYCLYGTVLSTEYYFISIHEIYLFAEQWLSSDVDISSKLLFELWIELATVLSLELLRLSWLVGSEWKVEAPCDVDLTINARYYRTVGCLNSSSVTPLIRSTVHCSVLMLSLKSS
jgi:hypothetical protein